jgi:hypothetical protein
MPIEYLEGGVLYENSRPQARSRHGYFPGLAPLSSGELIALFVIAEAFEAAGISVEETGGVLPGDDIIGSRLRLRTRVP